MSKFRNYPVLLSGAIVLAVAVWMLSGVFASNPEPAAATADANAARTQALQVRVQDFQARETNRELIISGRTEPDRVIDVRAEAEGVVTRIDAERGTFVNASALLFQLDLRDRNAQLAEAAALVAQRELEHKALQDLRGRNFTTDVQIAEATAQLESARARHERIRLDIANTSVRAPIDAVLQDRSVEVGDFVRVGDTVAQLVDLDPLIFVGEVNEREVSLLDVGSKGTATLVDGTELTGQLRYVAAVADAGTRTFRVELAVPNPASAIRAGQTAEMRLVGDRIRVHTLSAALLTLDDDGTIGVKTVDNDSRVKFYPVQIAGSSPDGMQVTGLPDRVRVITVGQGFASEGQRVSAVDVSPLESAGRERAN
ncbi:MAG: efflux RND transporter periplasmic adaptor subunit [Pseudomonadota bacterium]|nr:efflux RND transporter periplasmic adaptor subunit [Pseudomonadota bacterium]